MEIIFGGFCAILGGLVGALASYRLNQKNELQRAAFIFIDTLAETLADLEIDDFKKPIEILEPNFKSQHAAYIKFRERLSSPRKELLKKAWITFAYGSIEYNQLCRNPFTWYCSNGRKDAINKIKIAKQNLEKLIAVADVSKW